jgi:hypothetical protein
MAKEHRMKLVWKIALLLWGAASLSVASGRDFSFAGQFSRDDNRRVFTFTLAQAGAITVRSYSYAGGVMAGGATVPPGGFDPSVFLFDGAGALIAANADGGCAAVAADPVTGQCWDARLNIQLPAGTYQLVLTEYDNAAFGPTLADGFLRDGAGNFTAAFTGMGATPFWDATPAQRTGAWALDIGGVDAAQLSQSIGTPALLAIGDGNNQSAVVRATFGAPLRARVLDSGGNPVSGVAVTFAAPVSGASAVFTGGLTVSSDGNGYAAAPVMIANTIAGGYNISATAQGLSAPVQFSARNLAGSPARATAVAGSGQSAYVGTPFTTPLQVRIQDQDGNPVGGLTVAFSVPRSGASGAFEGGGQAQTDSQGVATAPAFSANNISGSYTVTASPLSGQPAALFQMTNSSRLAQTITFAPLPDLVIGAAPFTLVATASSGLPVSFSIESGPATLSGSTLTVTGVGRVMVVASQPGNAGVEEAPTVFRSFNVVRATQTIAFAPISDHTVGDAPFTISATASSGLPVDFTVIGPASIQGTAVTVTGAGTVSITASQEGSAIYLPAAVTQTFQVKATAAPIFILAPASAGFGIDGGAGTVALTAVPVTAPWTAVSDNSWIHVQSGDQGPGNGTVLYTVDPNQGAASRQGSLTIAGVKFPVTQASAAACLYQLTPISAILSDAAATGEISVTTSAAACSWTAASDSSWISISAGGSGKGAGVTKISVAANPGPGARSGSVTIGGATFTVSQEGPCTVALGSGSGDFGPAGGPGSVAISASRAGGGACAYSAAVPPSWITIVSGGAGAGSGTLAFVVAENSSLQARSAALAIGGASYTVTQQGATCSITLASSDLVFGAPGGRGSVRVQANNSACAWSASSNAEWVTLGPKTSGAGDATVSFDVASNGSASSRGAAVQIAGQSVRVQQSGLECEFKLRSTSGGVPESGGTGSVAVMAASGCSWSARSNAGWVSITSGASGSGNAEVSYEAQANPDPAPRTAALTIAGIPFSVTQDAKPCAYSLPVDSAQAAAAGGAGSFGFTASSESCHPSASGSSGWISITGVTMNGGAGTVGYSVDAYSGGAPRSGAITLANQSFAITQAAPACSFQLLDYSATFSRKGGQGVLRFRARGDGGCAPSISADPELTLGTLVTTTDGFELPYTVPGAASFGDAVRVFTIRVSGETFTVKRSIW